MQPPEEKVAIPPAGAAGKSARGSDGDGKGDGAEEDSEEPVLKYQRMGADVGRMLSEQKEKESIVRIAVHDSYLVSIDSCTSHCPD